MFEEPIRFIEDVIRNDRSVLDLLYGNYTFVNPVLARHYGMPGVTGKRRSTGCASTTRRSYGRGGLLPMAVFLTQNAPGLRTSPVKRGYWVVRRVLGETIPPPPPDVPELPQRRSEARTCRCATCWPSTAQNPACAGCHARFDSFGLAFEGYGPVGESADQGSGRPRRSIRRPTFPGGSEGAGFEGVQAYIREHRQKDFLDNLSRKLLAYALGRSLHALRRAARRADANAAGRERLSLRLPGGDHRHQPAVPEQTKRPDSREQKGE